MYPLVVDPDAVVEEDDRLQIAGAHPESIVGLLDDCPLLVGDTGCPRPSSSPENRDSASLPVLPIELLHPADGDALSPGNLLIRHPSLALTLDDPLNLTLSKHNRMPIIPPYTPPKLAQPSLPYYRVYSV